MALPLTRLLPAALMLLASAGAARAQAGLEAALSPECRLPASALYVAGALPRVDWAVRQGERLRVLVLGPFPAGGFGSGPGAPKYTQRLQAELERVLPGSPVTVEARRLPGEITAGAPEYITGSVMEVRPDLVIWSAGTHDAMARAEIDAFAAAVGEALHWLRSHRIDTVVVEPPYAAAVEDDGHYSALVQRLRAVARQHQAPVVLRYDATRHLAHRTGAATGRPFELNDLSRRCTPEYVAGAVAASLAGRP